jgi:8-oxo-dGTP pyrophosphatase MutT (NUDIX family)
MLRMLGDVIGKLRKLRLSFDDAAGAAVTMLLREEEGDLKVLLVKRAPRDTDPWSGHMAFPGGRRSPLDTNLMGTACRETLEETGIDLSECTLIGNLDTFNSNVDPDLFIQPFVFVCQKKPKIVLNEELTSYLWVSLVDLKESIGNARIGLGEVPAFFIAGEVVWGLTYRMIDSFYRIIMDKN